MNTLIDTQQCTKCGEVKELTEFHKRAASKDGLRPRCKACEKAHRPKLNFMIPEGLTEKRCGQCCEVKPIAGFSRDKTSTTGLQFRCRACRSEHYQANRERVLAQTSEYVKNRRASDPTIRLIERTRRGLSAILKGESLNPEYLELLGCTGEEWRTHLESTFKPGMTWENYGRGEGKWEIDHITPVASFDQEDHLQRLICWNYRNTQALWGHENMAKGDTISTEGGAA